MRTDEEGRKISDYLCMEISVMRKYQNLKTGEIVFIQMQNNRDSADSKCKNGRGKNNG